MGRASELPEGGIVVGVNIYCNDEGATGLEPICGAAELVTSPVSLYTARDPDRPELLSPVAGVAGRQLRVMIGTNVSLPNVPLHDYGITSVLLEEAGDKPCRVVLWGGVLDGDKGPDGRKLAEASLAGCNPGGLIDIVHPSLKENPDRFLAAVDVCNSSNKHNDRIKGLRLRGAHLQMSGVYVLAETASEFQPNCGVTGDGRNAAGWSSGVNTNGTIAVGLLAPRRQGLHRHPARLPVCLQWPTPNPREGWRWLLNAQLGGRDFEKHHPRRHHRGLGHPHPPHWRSGWRRSKVLMVDMIEGEIVICRTLPAIA